MSAQQAARLLAIGRTTLYELIKRHEVTPIHIGRCVRFSVVELTDLVARLSATAARVEVTAAATPADSARRTGTRQLATWAEPTLF